MAYGWTTKHAYRRLGTEIEAAHKKHPLLSRAMWEKWTESVYHSEAVDHQKDTLSKIARKIFSQRCANFACVVRVVVPGRDADSETVVVDAHRQLSLSPMLMIRAGNGVNTTLFEVNACSDDELALLVLAVGVEM